MSAGFCHEHQMWLNEFGWCDRCGEPVATLNPPISLGSAPVIIRDDFKGREAGTHVRACEGVIHVYESVPGECQCGQNWWDGKTDTDGPAWITYEDDRAV